MKKEKKNKDYIEKKDLRYVIAFLCFAIILLITNDLGSNEKTVNYIGFAGTLISIILAAIAIIYSFFYHLTNISTTEKLIDSANTLEDASKDIDESVSHLLQFTDNIDSIKRRVLELEQNIGDKFDKSISDLAESITTVTKDFNSDDIEKSINAAKNILDNGLLSVTKVVYFLYIAYKTQKSFRIKISSMKVIYNDESKVNAGLFLAFMSIFQSLNLIVPIFEDDEILKVKVVEFNQELENMMLEYGSTYHEESLLQN